ncbi:Uncharacterised protein [uncultured Blautia sp.]|uniref:Uncharacterized protein n=1 Tax=Blautia hydrogenotrophica (strain DSM 10507 / JCM 14656 / S5a33) TaxID=476272 RepID=C0CQI3_BLAHS|nr:hypothetical protein RUMHYD_03146 [Blautia hydrogenotrophica DSM 10507]SCH76579.1 Uncharacterised protein [uncultured Blautia sp.]
MGLSTLFPGKKLTWSQRWVWYSKNTTNCGYREETQKYEDTRSN